MERPEPGPRFRAIPVLMVAPRCALLDPVHDRPHLVHPVRRGVPRVPDQPDPPAWAEDAGELAEGAVGIEPVERLRDGDCIQGPGCDRQRLGDGGDDGDVGHGGDEPSAHPLDGLRRDHRRAGRHEQSRELARSRREVEHDAAGPEVKVVDQPRHRVGGVRGTDPFVHLGPAAEAFLGDLVDGHPAIFAGGRARLDALMRTSGWRGTAVAARASHAYTIVVPAKTSCSARCSRPTRIPMNPRPSSRKESGNVITRIATRPAPTRLPSRRTSSSPMIAIPKVRPHAVIGAQK